MGCFKLQNAVVVAAIVFTYTSQGQSPLATKVVLDPQTFTAADLATLQPLANVVASNVDILIPGRMSEFISDGIPVYKKLPTMSALIQAPITISTAYLLPGEPKLVEAGHTRIALDVSADYPEQFMFQLAHELAHVKMGVRVDNYLVETLAFAVSLQIMVRLGHSAYVSTTYDVNFQALPAVVKQALLRRDEADLRGYWQAQIASQGTRIDDRVFQALGAYLILSHPVPWPALLGIALANGNCLLNNPPVNLSLCPPDISRMHVMQPILSSLGYPE